MFEVQRWHESILTNTQRLAIIICTLRNFCLSIFFMKQLPCRNISLGRLTILLFFLILEKISHFVSREQFQRNPNFFVHLKDTYGQNATTANCKQHQNKGTTWLYIFDKSPNVSSALNCHINHRSRVQEEVDKSFQNAKMKWIFKKWITPMSNFQLVIHCRTGSQ